MWAYTIVVALIYGSILCACQQQPISGQSYCNNGKCNETVTCDLGICCDGTCYQHGFENVSAGEPCSPNDLCSTCVNGSFCNGTVCSLSLPPLGGQKGCPCSADTDCEFMFVCVNGVCDFGHGAFGQTCHNDKQCSAEENLKCYNGICKRNVTLGESCNVVDTGRLCDPNINGQWSRCIGGLCQAIPGPGEACTVSFGQDPCPPWYFCARNGSNSPSGLCQLKYSLAAGAICAGFDQCLPNLYCNVTLFETLQGQTGLCTVPTSGGLCSQVCPGTVNGLQECVCGGPNQQTAVCTTPPVIPDCSAQVSAMIACSLAHLCPDLAIAAKNGYDNVYDNSCWQRNCQSQLFAWQCCTCSLFPTDFRIVGLSCFPSPTYTTPTCCSAARQQGNCTADIDSCVARPPLSIPVVSPPTHVAFTSSLTYSPFWKLFVFFLALFEL